jgi:uncharacterized membrane protein
MRRRDFLVCDRDAHCDERVVELIRTEYVAAGCAVCAVLLRTEDNYVSVAAACSCGLKVGAASLQLGRRTRLYRWWQSPQFGMHVHQNVLTYVSHLCHIIIIVTVSPHRYRY